MAALLNALRQCVVGKALAIVRVAAASAKIIGRVSRTSRPFVHLPVFWVVVVVGVV
jgi:hypothetical protein